jgi:hypothetical protein
MRQRPARVIAGVDHDPRPETSTTGRRGRLKRFALATAAAGALLPAALATLPAAQVTAAAYSHPSLEPCPCTDPICRPACVQT